MEYFTRGEFAKLRGVAFNSLRYYEKLGLLRPAHMNKETGYRYYTSEQLAELDTIQLAISLGIPLNRLKEYGDKDGTLQCRRLFEDGRELMEEKIRELQSGIHRVEYSLQNMDDDAKYKGKQGQYTRTIRERYIFTKQYDGKNADTHKIETLAAELYTQAQTKHLAPIPPMGQLFQNINGVSQHDLFFEITSIPAGENENIVRLPETECLCCQVELFPDTDLLALIRDNYELKPNMTVIVSNMIFDKFCFGSRPCELQVIAQESGTENIHRR